MYVLRYIVFYGCNVIIVDLVYKIIEWLVIFDLILFLIDNIYICIVFLVCEFFNEGKGVEYLVIFKCVVSDSINKEVFFVY